MEDGDNCDYDGGDDNGYDYDDDKPFHWQVYDDQCGNIFFFFFSKRCIF